LTVWGSGRSWATRTTPGGVWIRNAAKETSKTSLHPLLKSHSFAAHVHRALDALLNMEAIEVEASGMAKEALRP
jgi:hypothetical protein